MYSTTDDTLFLMNAFKLFEASERLFLDRFFKCPCFKTSKCILHEIDAYLFSELIMLLYMKNDKYSFHESLSISNSHPNNLP